MKKLYRALACVCVLVIIILLLMIFKECREKEKDKETFEDILILATTSEDEGAQTAPVPDSDEEIKSTPPQINLPILRETNPHCAMWIYVEGTNINYPVMYTPDNPEEYIYKNFYGKKSSSGTPFLDGRCTDDSENLIIYGHNMLNGTMFAGLKKYLDKGFYNQHKTMVLYNDTPVEYEVFAVVKTKSCDPWYSYILEADESVIKELNEKSLYKTDSFYEKGDTFLTLSTCYGREDDDRLLVVAIAKH